MGSTISQAERAANRRLVVCALLTLPLVAIAMGPHLADVLGFGSDESDGMGGMEGMEGMEGMDMPGMEDPTASTPAMDMATDTAWLQLALATPVVVYGGGPFFQRAFNAARSRMLTMDTLAAIGVGTAFVYSIFATLGAAWATAGLYYETAAVVVTLILFGRWIERRARRKAAASLEALLEQDSAGVQGIAQTVEDAQLGRTPLQAAVDGVVRYFVPLVLFLALVSFAFWNTTGAPIAREAGMDPQSMALLSLISVLIIACPCALGLATPLATLVGSVRAAQHGLIIKASEAFHEARRTQVVAFTPAALEHANPMEAKDAIALVRHRGLRAGVLAGTETSDRLASEHGLEAIPVGPAVAVVGRGISDEAVLRKARLGIAGLEGTNLGDQAGAIVVLKHGLVGAVEALDLAKQTMRKVHHNLAWAFAFNVALVPVAAGALVLFPVAGRAIMLDPMYAGLAMTLSILSVSLSSLSLRSWSSARVTPLASRATPA